MALKVIDQDLNAIKGRLNAKLDEEREGMCGRMNRGTVGAVIANDTEATKLGSVKKR
jgi:hypothetical protein